MPDPERGLEPVLDLARRAAATPVDVEEANAGRARIVNEAVRLRHEVPRQWRHVLVPLAAMTLAVTVIAFLVYTTTRSLRYDVVGAETAGSTDYVSAKPDAPAEVRFSDGSRVVATPGARVRVEGTERRGARVLVEKGAIDVAVKHREQSNWRFGAGPYEVRVTGTKFRLAWDPERAEIDLQLFEGSVDVESAVGPKRVEVRAGQSFHASAREGSMRVDNVVAAPPAPAPAVSSAAPQQEPVARETPKPVTEAKPRASQDTWPDLMRRGRYADIVTDAKARGVDICLKTCSSGDLRALADAARYSGEATLAVHGFEALRARFAGSADAQGAAFLIGRTYESTADLAAADRWYSVYLEESPKRKLASDAIEGRLRIAKLRAAKSPRSGAKD